MEKWAEEISSKRDTKDWSAAMDLVCGGSWVEHFGTDDYKSRTDKVLFLLGAFVEICQGNRADFADDAADE